MIADHHNKQHAPIMSIGWFVEKNYEDDDNGHILTVA